jgi:hypothetical protein
MMTHRWSDIGIFILTVLLFLGLGSAQAYRNPEMLGRGLEEADVVYYPGDGPAGGLAHVDYWTIDDTSGLSEREKLKVDRIVGNRLHSALFEPWQVVAGYEAHGILNVDGRRQWLTLKLPDQWNRKLIVCGCPGLRNEYANEATFVPWLLEMGYAVISGNKGLDNSWESMLTGTHPSQHWGQMMHDLAQWAKSRIITATHRGIKRVYAVGLSNGGYQVRRALEIDNRGPRRRRIFDGGLDWSGTYFAAKEVLDANKDGMVSVQEYASAKTLVGHMDTACLTMGWAYGDDTLTTPEQYGLVPRYPDARKAMLEAGFNQNSDIFWGFYNTNYDIYKDYGLLEWQGVGYQNLVSYVYRAELLGHDLVQSAAYSCFYDPDQPDQRPPLYDWLESAVDGGWTTQGVQYALANANTARFKVPMITLVGDADGLLAIHAHSLAYGRAVKKYGRRWLHRLYVIANAPHVDAHADGREDFDFDGTPNNEGAADELTPMQAYTQRAFDYLVDWVEKGIWPPKSTFVATDPGNDAVDPSQLSW